MVNNNFRVPRILTWLILPSAISLVVLTLYSLILLAVLGPSSDFNFLQWLPYPVAMVVIAWGAYTGMGVAALWVAMWAYWATMEKSPARVRVGWFLVLLLGMHYGALIYLLYIWKKGILTTNSIDP